MKVQTYYLTLDYGYGNEFTFYGLSRVALKRYIEWFRDQGDCGIEYGPAYVKTRP